ncbi:uncharacterized protein BO80DRAFT_422648 [Aspergillus ibericus CBS 121593]|uniref:BZIP domain-containing protein n=1 Tax=Aspergillus ibericus CBS 121593 TaxID=1448316 RepID=A0A395H7V8_9EURO|nr:hypothetical protein BO80DRAFT_422648 [Aspergillus ibericus CBS 121593]RAL03716.1 hypothetical protein BO80DRAFT_422648 [Aspergillus ibericus CBS 121593]
MTSQTPNQSLPNAAASQRSGPADKRIRLQQFSERIAAWPEDDWSGISDSKQRRRLQNRVNQRARRLRKKLEAVTSRDESSNRGGRSSAEVDDQSRVSATVENEMPVPRVHSEIDRTPAPLAAIKQVHILNPDSTHTQTILHQFEDLVRAEYMHSSPRTDMLLHLIEFNFIKALIQNLRLFDLTSEQLHDDAISPFNVAGPWPHDFEASLPLSLRATVVQRTVSHHPWLDLLPDAQMRDNLIRAGESYDETQLCLDMKGHGIIVWRDPWDASGWEISESFARSWGWVLRGCWDLARSTNYWRARRNEKPLFRCCT